MGPLLPIDAVIPTVLGAMAPGRNLVIEAPPGAGKTTRVPPALLHKSTGSVLVLEPRRIAARMASRRVASESGESLGETVGYQVRFEEVASPRTRLKFVTEGVLTRTFLANPELRNTSTVVLDEFHERHLDADLALALLRRLQFTSRPDLSIIVMSATLNAQPIAEYLDARVVRSEGRLFDVDVRYAPHSDVAAAVESLGALDGHVLVFLPGAAEIRRAARNCEPIARRLGLAVLPLHGDLPAEEQDRAVAPSSTPKLILATNVAESSITIDGVTTVIDSGLARIPVDSVATGLPTLEVRRISKASATQRAGRAGRTQPGRAIRLYSVEDFVRRPDHDTPEISRRDLSQMLVELRALGISDVPWFEAPPAAAVAAAAELLDRLGASPRDLARYPVHPRLARMLMEADAARIAAWLSAGERTDEIDALHLLDAEPPFKVRQIERQLRHTARRRATTDESIAKAILAAYPDRVARRRSGRDVQLASGKPALLAADFNPQLFVAVDIEDRRDGRPPLVRLASRIEPEWLLDHYPDRIRERRQTVWNRTAERVEAVSALLYEEIPIEESPAEPDPEAAAALLAEQALSAGLHRFLDVEALDAVLARIDFAAQHGNIHPAGEAEVRSALVNLCAGLRSFGELKEAATNLPAIIKAHAGPELDAIAPERIPLKNRQVRVHYLKGQTPYIASRLQDFFGLKETPRIARGAVPVVVHLLAPNQRPIQTTTDLAGFWERLYPQVRRELSRRYPKHAWPETCI